MQQRKKNTIYFKTLKKLSTFSDFLKIRDQYSWRVHNEHIRECKGNATQAA
jgi:hypothetical protein